VLSTSSIVIKISSSYSAYFYASNFLGLKNTPSDECFSNLAFPLYCRLNGFTGFLRIMKFLSFPIFPLCTLNYSDGDLSIFPGLSGPSDMILCFFGVKFCYFKCTLLLKSGVLGVFLSMLGNRCMLGLALSFTDLIFFNLSSGNLWGEASAYSRFIVSERNPLILSLTIFSRNISCTAGLRCSLWERSLPTNLFYTMIHEVHAQIFGIMLWCGRTISPNNLEGQLCDIISIEGRMAIAHLDW